MTSSVKSRSSNYQSRDLEREEIKCCQDSSSSQKSCVSYSSLKVERDTPALEVLPPWEQALPDDAHVRSAGDEGWMSSNQMVPVGDMFPVMGKKKCYYSDQNLFRKTWRCVQIINSYPSSAVGDGCRENASCLYHKFWLQHVACRL